MILLWGLREDAPLARVMDVLERSGAPHVFVDQRAVLESEVELTVDGSVGGFVRVGDTAVDLASVTSAYVRPYDSWRIGEVARSGIGSPEGRHALSFDETLWLWAELSPALIVNRPSAMASNSSKPYQAVTIRSHGFAVPETLITTDVEAVRAFHDICGFLVYKSVSGRRSIVSRLTADDETRLGDVAWCPTQFQQYIPGSDYRVHVVGDEVFCARIESGADDYRYSERQGSSVSMTPEALPAEWAHRCRALTASLDFVLAGIDLRRTPGDEWYCFEVNPSPAFTYYDRHREGMAEAVASLLTSPGALNERR